MNRIIIFLLFLAAGRTASAQTGVIKGQVTNRINNGQVGEADLLVEATDKGSTSGPDGYYEITGRTPGLYNLRVSYVGFQEQTIYEIQLTRSESTAASSRPCR